MVCLAIPNTFLDELTARCPIEEVVADYLPLTPKGGNLWGLCPFHGEKTPSFSVSPDKHIFHCFGCGKGGGVIRFVMEMEGLSFYEAVEKLALRAGLEVPQEDDGERRRRARRRRLLELNRQAARFYHDTLKSPLGEPMRAYIAQRRLSGTFATRFGLGAAPEGWDHLTRAMTALGYEKGELLDAGLVVANKTGGVYDKFRNRLMLPVIDAAGDVLGFTSRVMDDSTPKYLNTPETSLFKKRSILYGINFAKQTKRDFFLLVEGNLDVITLHQAGFDNAVATMGTALTAEHVRLIGRYTHQLVLCYDNDAAGVEATERAMAVLRETDFQVKVLQLPRRKTPEGELVKQDPDDFIKYQGPAAFQRLLDGSENQSAYRLSTIAQKYTLTKDEDRAAFLREAAKMISSLPSPVEREIYAGRAAALGEVSKDAMLREVENLRKQASYKSRRKEEREALSPARLSQPQDKSLRYENVRSARSEEGIIRLLFLEPALLDRMPALSEDEFSVPLWGRLYRGIVQRYQEGKSVSPAAFEEELSGEEAGLLARLLQTPQSLGEGMRAMTDYIEILREEAQKRSTDQQDPLAALLETRSKLRKKTLEDGT